MSCQYLRVFILLDFGRATRMCPCACAFCVHLYVCPSPFCSVKSEPLVSCHVSDSGLLASYVCVMCLCYVPNLFPPL